MSQKVPAVADPALIYCSWLYWLPILSGWREIRVLTMVVSWMEPKLLMKMFTRSSTGVPGFGKNKCHLQVLISLSFSTRGDFPRWQRGPTKAAACFSSVIILFISNTSNHSFVEIPQLLNLLCLFYFLLAKHAALLMSKNMPVSRGQWETIFLPCLLHKAIKFLIMQAAHSDLNRWFPLRCLQKAEEF